MKPDDEVFIWRASGHQKIEAGVIARGVLTDTPKERENDQAAKKLWSAGEVHAIEPRVSLRLVEKCLEKKRVIKRDWIKSDPVLSGLRILKLSTETNYLIKPNEALRLSILVRNTGRDWNREESLAGLWAYAHSRGRLVSTGGASPVATVALAIGRAISGVEAKVENFKAIDPTDQRKGLSAVGKIDKQVWAEFFDVPTQKIQVEKLDKEFQKLWGTAQPALANPKTYKDFGDAPNDDPEELQQFAKHIRWGQPAFRKNLLAAYGNQCVVTGHGPPEVLEAIHIMPHAKTGINELDNGLLMRADLHTLFDAGLLKIEPDSLKVVLDDSLLKTPYGNLHGITLRNRKDGRQIGSKYLRILWNTEKPL